MTTKTKPDWAAIRTEYVNGTLTVAAIAKKFGVSESSAEKRASREKWKEERQQKSEYVQKEANSVLVTARIAELSKFNEDDLVVARALRSQVAASITKAKNEKRDLGANELRALASAAEASQRIGRLALGASTANNEIAGPNQTPIPVASVTTEAYLIARKKALEEF